MIEVTPTASLVRAEAVIDLDAIVANIERLRSETTAQIMVVVKADAYGHGMLPVARCARRQAVGWLGVALPEEALALRAAGDSGRILAWLMTPGQDSLVESLRQEVDLGVSTEWAMSEVIEAARVERIRARVHLKVDTGLGRAGATLHEWAELVAMARAGSDEGLVDVVGVWSHLVSGEDPDSPITTEQARVFGEALATVREAGLSPEWIHLGNSGATLSGVAREWGIGDTLVRTGIAVYGITPGRVMGEASSLGLQPAMTLRARLAQVKQVRAGHGVSYGHHWVATRDTRLGLVPLGYADGLPRTAQTPEVFIAGRRCPVVGRIAMDQCVVDLGDLDVDPGEEVIVFGSGHDGEPTAEEWAAWADTIGYEIVTRIGPRVPRRYLGQAVSGGESATDG